MSLLQLAHLFPFFTYKFPAGLHHCSCIISLLTAFPWRFLSTSMDLTFASVPVTFVCPSTLCLATQSVNSSTCKSRWCFWSSNMMMAALSIPSRDFPSVSELILELLSGSTRAFVRCMISLCLNYLSELTSCCSPSSSFTGLIIPQVHQVKLCLWEFSFSVLSTFLKILQGLTLSFYARFYQHHWEKKFPDHLISECILPLALQVHSSHIPFFGVLHCLHNHFFLLLLNFTYYILSHCSCPSVEYKLWK